jgi:hypothetical protein
VTLVAKTQYYTATSIDGFIADQDNSLDWLFSVDGGAEGQPVCVLLRGRGGVCDGRDDL